MIAYRYARIAVAADIPMPRLRRILLEVLVSPVPVHVLPPFIQRKMIEAFDARVSE